MLENYTAFPIRETESGDERKTGVEVEYVGLDELPTAELIVRHLGGSIRDDGPHRRVVEGTQIGDLGVELDTQLRAYKDVPLLDKGLEVAKAVVPVEVITAPLTRDQVEQFGDLLVVFRDAGAVGSRAGMLLGFGVHLNPEVVGADHPHTLNTILAFGIMEAWLRRREDLDVTRRLMPFVSPWPHAFVTELAKQRPDTLVATMRIHAKHVDTRNHGLDLLPLFSHFQSDAFKGLYPEQTLNSARPTFHFRLPDCRIDEADWSLARPWGLWLAVEKVAADTDLLDRLRLAWLDHDHRMPGASARWSRQVDVMMKASIPEAVA